MSHFYTEDNGTQCLGAESLPPLDLLSCRPFLASASTTATPATAEVLGSELFYSLRAPSGHGVVEGLVLVPVRLLLEVGTHSQPTWANRRVSSNRDDACQCTKFCNMEHLPQVCPETAILRLFVDEWSEPHCGGRVAIGRPPHMALYPR